MQGTEVTLTKKHNSERYDMIFRVNLILLCLKLLKFEWIFQNLGNIPMQTVCK